MKEDSEKLNRIPVSGGIAAATAILEADGDPGPSTHALDTLWQLTRTMRLCEQMHSAAAGVVVRVLVSQCPQPCTSMGIAPLLRDLESLYCR